MDKRRTTLVRKMSITSQRDKETSMYKVKKRNLVKVSIIVALAVAMLFSCLAIVFGGRQTARAITDAANQSTNLGEMLLEGYEEDTTGKGNVFDGEVFWELIKEISGVANPTESTLNNLGTKTSANFRSQNGGKDVVVTIGGKQWTATYLSQTSNGPILTLWLANSATTAQWNTAYQNSDGNYPSNMYGTSWMRASILNNGGSYAAKYNDSSLTPVSQSEANEWAIYTMPSKKGSLTQFIEVPNSVSWQTGQQISKDKVTWPSSSYNYNNNNDSLNYGGDGPKGSYLGKTGYKNWGNDRLWLPSVAETGTNNVEGIWQASVNQRANSTYSWLRSAF